MGPDRRAPRPDDGSDAGQEHADPAKAALRQAVLARRRARRPDERTALAVRLRDVVLGEGLLPPRGAVACYSSRGGEPGTWPLVAALTARGTRVLLPHTHDGSDGGGVRLGWGEAARAPGPLDVPPLPGPDLGPDALGAADVVLVPALAVDTAGARLGRGGGYYDRALARLGALRGSLPHVVALVHDDEVLDAGVQPVPAAPHDVRVTHVATPLRLRRLGGP